MTINNMVINIEIDGKSIEDAVIKAMVGGRTLAGPLLGEMITLALQLQRSEIQHRINKIIDSIIKDASFEKDLTDRVRSELLLGAANKAARIAAGGGTRA